MAGANNDGAVRAWLLTDGTAGHESQSRGVLDALAAAQPVSVERVNMSVRSTTLRRLGRLLLQLRLPLPRWLLPAAFDIDLPATAPAPQLVVSSGGDTLLANALLARRYRARSVYSGTLKNYPAHTVDLVVSVTPQPARNNLVLALPPVPGEVSAVADLPPGKFLVLLVGGATREYPYSDADWQALVAAMVVLAQRSGRRWLVTTSRRSGDVVEKLLAEKLPPELVADCVLWGRAPRRVMRDFLGRAAQVFVTEDSLTMVAEAIWSARPVTSIGLAGSTPSANDAQALAGYEQAGLLARCTCATLAQAQLDRPLPQLPPVRAQIASALQQLLEGRR